MPETKIRCSRCVHFYVTWDPAMPRGCRALGFKCRETPAQVVRGSSGEECLYFREKRLSGKETGS